MKQCIQCGSETETIEYKFNNFCEYCLVQSNGDEKLSIDLSRFFNVLEKRILTRLSRPIFSIESMGIPCYCKQLPVSKVCDYCEEKINSKERVIL